MNGIKQFGRLTIPVAEPLRAKMLGGESFEAIRGGKTETQWNRTERGVLVQF
jgi:hypothetical protein